MEVEHPRRAASNVNWLRAFRVQRMRQTCKIKGEMAMFDGLLPLTE